MSATATKVDTKERPIILSGAMVRAILEGRKTQTRRVVKLLPVWFNRVHTCSGDIDRVTGQTLRHDCLSDSTGEFYRFCPYGKPGDRLWVRETWAPHDEAAINNRECEFIYYRADDETKYESDGAWHPSIFMPRWASRITLEVKAIRVERLQKISGFDARSEGYPEDMPDHTLMHDGGGRKTRQWFHAQWDTINARRGYSWESNPWVWVIEFKKL
jgi:hypothetical protein